MAINHCLLATVPCNTGVVPNLRRRKLKLREAKPLRALLAGGQRGLEFTQEELDSASACPLAVCGLRYADGCLISGPCRTVFQRLSIEPSVGWLRGSQGRRETPLGSPQPYMSPAISPLAPAIPTGRFRKVQRKRPTIRNLSLLSPR